MLHMLCGHVQSTAVRMISTQEYGAFWSAGHQVSAVVMLPDAAAYAELSSAGGRNPLHWAVLGDQAATVRFLLEKGAWVEASDAHDDTPLHLAARYLCVQ